MPIMRNPFRRQDENVRPATSGLEKFVNGSPTKPIDIKEREPAEYQLSEINDSGVFIPPSPPEERKSFWTTSSSRSTTSSASRSAFNENEPFNISRESFDSYRRSFDISARSPIIFAETKPRCSLDSRTFAPRQSNSFHRPLQVPGTQQEEDADADALEEIALDDPKPQPQKKRGMFSRMLDSDSHPERPGSHGQKDGAQKSSWHHFGGRKRGQSGQGAELGDIPKREETPRPVNIQVKKDESLPRKDESQVKEEILPHQQSTPQVQEQAVSGAEQQSSQTPATTVDAAS